jgi:hypothetical protein
MLWIVVGWLIFSIVVGAVAGARGRSGYAWVLLSLLISPLVAAIILAIVPDLAARELLERDLRRRSTVAILLFGAFVISVIIIFRLWLG